MNASLLSSIILATVSQPTVVAPHTLASAQAPTCRRVEVNAAGAFVREAAHAAAPAAAPLPGGSLAQTAGLVWTLDDGGQGWIGANVAVGNGGNEVFTEFTHSAQAATLLSANDGNPPTPLWSDGGALASTDQHVASAKNVGIHVSLHTFDQGLPSAQTVLSKYTTNSSGTPDWTFTFAPPTDGGSDCAISSDGQTIVAGITNFATSAVEIAVFSPASNVPLSYTSIPILPGNFVRGFDLSGDGSTLFFRATATGYVFDIASATVVFPVFLGGVFDSHAISGDGNIFAFGRLNQMRVYERAGPTLYVNTYTRSLAGSNYVAQIDISEDDSTIAYAFVFWDTYLTYRVEALDTATKTVTMNETVIGTGSYQNIVSSIATSFDGSRFVVGAWGDENGSSEELRLYARDLNIPLGLVDLPGSVYEVSISSDGTRVAAASKAVHENVSGSGGRIDLYADHGVYESFCFGDDLDPLVTTDCPCQNFGAAGHGCGNSVHPSGAQMFAAGNTTPDTVVLTVVNVPPGVGTIFLQGSGVFALGTVFGDGVRCAAGALTRLGLKIDDDNDGITHFGTDFGDPQVSVVGNVSAGASYAYQTYYRNPNPSWCPPATFNISQAIEIIW